MTVKCWGCPCPGRCVLWIWPSKFLLLGLYQGYSLCSATHICAEKFKDKTAKRFWARLLWNAKKYLARSRISLWCVLRHKQSAHWTPLVYQNTLWSSASGVRFILVFRIVCVNYIFETVTAIYVRSVSCSLLPNANQIEYFWQFYTIYSAFSTVTQQRRNSYLHYRDAV
jgi:hypothetical protein